MSSILKTPPDNAETSDSVINLGWLELETLFPFSVSFDCSLRVQFCGKSLLKIEPELRPGAYLPDFFSIKTPKIPFEIEAIKKRKSALHNWILNDSMSLRGQVVLNTNNDDLIFVGSPIIKSSGQLGELGLKVGDFALHDSTLDHLFLLQAQKTTVADSSRMVESLQHSISEKAEMEAIQADLAFELNIANDLKIRFKHSGTILDIQASPALIAKDQQKQLIGANVYKEISYLGLSLQQSVITMADDNDIVAFKFEKNSGRNTKYFESRLAKASNNVYLLLANDVTSQYKLQLQLERRANFDSLTKLPNRSYFIERVSQTIQKTSDQPTLYTLMTIDLDNFKNINDSYGHSAGDFTLETIARILLENTRAEDVLARMGGDEFSLFTAGNYSRKKMLNLAQRICRSILEPIKFKGSEFKCGCSIGVAFTESSDLEFSAFRNRADLAMYHSKEGGKGLVTAYKDGMYEKYQKKLSLRDALAKAIDEEALTLAYQPVVNTKSGALVGFEALARWQHPEQGVIPPTEFIAIAEEAGFMIALGRVLLKNAISTWKSFKMQNTDTEHLTLALNISAYQLYDNSLIGNLNDCLDENGLDSSQIVLEITETALIRDIEKAVGFIKDLKDQGFTIALDDFGTGFASLGYLEQLPLDILKIDRSFIAKIDSDTSKAPLVEAIVGIAKVLNLEIVAEGVEIACQKKFLGNLDCEFAQGYYYSKPIDAIHLLNNGEAFILKQSPTDD